MKISIIAFSCSVNSQVFFLSRQIALAPSSHRSSMDGLMKPFSFLYIYVFFTTCLFYCVSFLLASIFYGPGAGHGHTWTDPDLSNIYCRVLHYQLAALRSEFIRPSYLLISRLSKFHGPFSTFKFQPETLADVD